MYDYDYDYDSESDLCDSYAPLDMRAIYRILRKDKTFTYGGMPDFSDSESEESDYQPSNEKGAEDEEEEEEVTDDEGTVLKRYPCGRWYCEVIDLTNPRNKHVLDFCNARLIKDKMFWPDGRQIQIEVNT